ncbi:hypothetical protein [Paenibacillus tyrfis]|uniref:hypothetical protein n=1 Tax=Paenibacillus tyrfis TaxID=1501230 RepID=UPI0020A18DCC|nr:hypothetical protein [Paenibacillus tyrfis]MCP1306422.1 hypothetical protein [Paenibacillus tyrfis]
MIDQNKLIQWAQQNLIPPAAAALTEALEKGVFEPDKPSLKEGDKVRHTKHKYYGIGEVRGLSKSGKKARVKFGWNIAYYDLTALQKVEEAKSQ